MASITAAPSLAPARYRATRPAGGGDAPGPLGLGGLRLTRRGRLVTFLVALALAAPVGVLGAQAFAGTEARPVEVRLHSVIPGETLWDFARDVAVPGEDLRDVVRELRELNGMSTSTLDVGQVVAIPVG